MGPGREYKTKSSVMGVKVPQRKPTSAPGDVTIARRSRSQASREVVLPEALGMDHLSGTSHSGCWSMSGRGHTGSSCPDGQSSVQSYLSGSQFPPASSASPVRMSALLSRCARGHVSAEGKQVPLPVLAAHPVQLPHIVEGCVDDIAGEAQVPLLAWIFTLYLAMF